MKDYIKRLFQLGGNGEESMRRRYASAKEAAFGGKEGIGFRTAATFCQEKDLEKQVLLHMLNKNGLDVIPRDNQQRLTSRLTTLWLKSTLSNFYNF